MDFSLEADDVADGMRKYMTLMHPLFLVFTYAIVQDNVSNCFYEMIIYPPLALLFAPKGVRTNFTEYDVSLRR